MAKEGRLNTTQRPNDHHPVSAVEVLTLNVNKARRQFLITLINKNIKRESKQGNKNLIHPPD
jgi:hypothetical protein